MNAATTLIALMTILSPAKTWFSPDEPWRIHVGGEQAVALYMTDFAGRPIDAGGSADISSALPEVQPDSDFDLRDLYPSVRTPGTYLLYAVPEGSDSLMSFIGTPLVISVRRDGRAGADPDAMVAKIEPLQFMKMHTDKGTMTIGLFYDAAPHTVQNFLELAGGGFYDGLTFFRIVPDFIIQSGAPRGDGIGGPGYMIDAEFSDRPHNEGVLSMARASDPNETAGVPPEDRYANSAGSQFFISLNYDNTQQLDRRYTTFARVIEGLDVLQELASVPLLAGSGDRPVQPPVIEKIEILPVTADANPYTQLQALVAPPAMYDPNLNAEVGDVEPMEDENAAPAPQP